MDGLELISFQIIATVGTAKSMYVEAIHLAKEKKFEEAQAHLEEGEKIFNEGHHAHAGLIQQEADTEQDNVQINLILMHAEDQLITTDLFKIVAQEMIDMYKVIYN